MKRIKNIFSVFIAILMLISFSSCKTDECENTPELPEIDFSVPQTVQYQNDDTVLNFAVSFSDDGEMKTELIGEMPQAFENIEFTVNNGSFGAYCGTLRCETDLTSLPQSFCLNVIYRLLFSVRSGEAVFYYDETDNTFICNQTVCGENVCLVVNTAPDGGLIYYIEVL